MRLKFSLRSVLILGAAVLIIIGLSNMGVQQKESYPNMKFSDFVTNVKSGKIEEVLILGLNALSIDKAKKKSITQFPIQDSSFIQRLLDNNIKIRVVHPDNSPSFMSIFWVLLINWLPQIGFMIFLVWLNSARFNFGTSKAKKISQREKKATFADVAGLTEAKEELKEVVDFLRNPVKFTSVGAKIPNGVLLYGPPGTGKTLLARAIAGEAGVEFLIISGSEFVEMFVGVGASRVRDMFAQARKYEKCVIFIDELDSIGKKRNTIGIQNDERESTLNQLLTEMDGFLPNKQIIVIGATNRIDVLDPALLRPGRFDKIIQIPLPDAKGRQGIFEVNLNRVSTAPQINLKNAVNATIGASGADIAKIVNEAAIISAKDGPGYVTEEILEKALEMTLFGRKKTMDIHRKEVEITAYHESGHAIVNLFVPNSNPIYKASIEPTDSYLGVVIPLPEREEVFRSKEQLLDSICVLMGGRAAESIKFNQITSGASSDLEKANRIARKMVVELGMSDELKNLSFDMSDYYQRPSDQTIARIDQIVGKIIEEQWNRALSIINENIDKFSLLASNLLKFETLTGEQIKYLFQNGDLEGYKRLIDSDSSYIYVKSDPIMLDIDSNEDEEDNISNEDED